MVATKERPVCKKCGSGYIYVRLGGTVVCRACGHVEIAKKAG
jgi:hypothetical protein